METDFNGKKGIVFADNSFDVGLDCLREISRARERETERLRALTGLHNTCHDSTARESRFAVAGESCDKPFYVSYFPPSISWQSSTNI